MFEMTFSSDVNKVDASLPKSRNCIISVGVGHWYPRGLERLSKSLLDCTFQGSVILMDSFYNEEDTHLATPYYFKMQSFEAAFALGFDNILYVDASFWAVRDVTPIFDIIERDGYIIMDNPGHTTGRWCNDNALPLLGVTREEVDKMPHCMGGFIGLNKHSPIAMELFKKWQDTPKEAYRGSWENHRHDQTILSVHSYKLGMKWHDHKGILDYNCADDSVFYLRGM